MSHRIKPPSRKAKSPGQALSHTDEARRRQMSLDRDGMLEGAVQVPSPNFDERPSGAEVTLVVVHAISLPPGVFGGGAIEQFFTNTLDFGSHPFFETLRDLRVSSHFLIRRDGRVVQFVSCDKRAWHAGVSCHAGRTRCNDFSIGIELEGDGEVAYTDAQYEALASVIGALRQRHPVADVVGHSDIAPGRKTDPGASFDWVRLRAALQHL